MAANRAPSSSLAAAGLLLAVSLRPAPAAAEAGWPRRIGVSEATFTFYQPQVDRWADEVLEGRAAVAAVRKGEKEPTVGVVWLRARTALGRDPGQVTLEEIEFTRASFPWERDGGKEILEAIRRSAGTAATVPVASLNASPAVVLSVNKATQATPPKIPTPRIIVPKGPSLLVLVDGDFIIKPVPGMAVLRVVNTRMLLLQDAASSRFYLPLMNRWLVAPAPNGKWSIAKRPPRGLDAVRRLAAEEPEVELLDMPGEDVKALLRAGKAPAVFVSTTPAVLASKVRKPEKTPPPAATRDGRPGGLFAGPDGNVYRPRPGGGWDKTNGRDWYPLQEPRGSSFGFRGPLDREREAREAGYTQRPKG
jgi:hypothetical protein